MANVNVSLEMTKFTKNLSKQIDATVRKQIKPLIRQQMNNNIKENIYGAGQPTYYQRRKSHGGLIDSKNFLMTMEYNGTTNDTMDTQYTFTNATTPAGNGWHDSDGYIRTLEYGNKHPLFGTINTWYNQPRPFIQPLKDDEGLSEQVTGVIIQTIATTTTGDNSLYQSVYRIFANQKYIFTIHL